jgi:hypothetical protein
MHRTDKSRFLLYLEPKARTKHQKPINDELTELMKFALRYSERGTANYNRIGDKENFTKDGGWRGIHVTDCGERSTNQDYLLKNGMITNSLAPFYLMYYRSSIPRKEIKKVIQLYRFYHSNESYEFIRKNSSATNFMLRVWYSVIYLSIHFPKSVKWPKLFYDDDDDQALD